MQRHNRIWSSRFAAAATLGFATLLSISAAADPKACITAHASGQREAKAGHLRLATQLFTTCGSDETCPGPLRHECAEYLQEVLQTMPTVLFSVKDEKGQEVMAVKVFSTDELVVDGLDGRAIQIDPGKHRLRFLMPSGAVVSSDVLIREGEKNRVISVKLAPEGGEEDAPIVTHSSPPPVDPAKPGTQTPPPAAPPPSTPAPTRSSPPTAAWIAGGAAVVALGVGTTFAILGSSKKSDIDACSPNCGSDKRDTFDGLKRDYLIADIGFAVGLVSAGIATWLFVSPPAASSESGVGTATNRRRLPIKVGGAALPNGGAVVVDGSF